MLLEKEYRTEPQGNESLAGFTLVNKYPGFRSESVQCDDPSQLSETQNKKKVYVKESSSSVH